MVSDASKKFEAPQQPETPAPRRRRRRMRKRTRKVCPKCESIGQKRHCHEGPWANGMCWRHAVENGCQPPVPRSKRVCKKCQEIVHKEEEATRRRLGTGGFPLVLTKTRWARTETWADGMCWLHARQAGRSEEKLFNKGGKMNIIGPLKKQHRQMKLPFSMVPKESQCKMALEEEEFDGSIEPPPENPLEASVDSTFRRLGCFLGGQIRIGAVADQPQSLVAAAEQNHHKQTQHAEYQP